MKKDKWFELLIVILSISGTMFVSSLNSDKQFTGFVLWLFGNALAVGFFFFNKMYLMMFQFVVYLIITIKALVERC